jgi:hypothetical protein
MYASVAQGRGGPDDAAPVEASARSKTLFRAGYAMGRLRLAVSRIASYVRKQAWDRRLKPRRSSLQERVAAEIYVTDLRICDGSHGANG